MKVTDIRFSYSFHPHYTKFLKTGIKLNVPCYNTLWCNNARMCVIHSLESDSERGVKFFFKTYFLLQACEERKGMNMWFIFLDYDKFQNLSSDLEKLY